MYPADIYRFKVINVNKGTRTRRKGNNKDTSCYWQTIDVALAFFIVNCEHISHIFLLFLLLALSMRIPLSNDIERFPGGLYSLKVNRAKF